MVNGVDRLEANTELSYQLLEARQLAERVIAVDSNNFEQLVALGIIELKSGNAEQALANFTKAVP